jgi:general secretion pathway protein G
MGWRALPWVLFAGLVALLLAAWKFVVFIPEDWPAFLTKMEIGQMETGLAAFYVAHGVPHVPSRIKLSERCDYPQRDVPETLDYDSVEYLRKLWPQIDLSPGSALDWNGDGQARGDWILEGDECLVFFLGGIPRGGDGPAPDCLGFARNARDPIRPGGERDGPYFEFHTGRLRDVHGRGFLSYLDPWGERPYAFFSSYGIKGGYNRYGGTDCPTLGVWPYAKALGITPRFLNPSGVQILSAGPDRRFGPGTDDESHVWSPTIGRRMPPVGQVDLSNFCEGPLGGMR